jgi:hypothetical protein
MSRHSSGLPSSRYLRTWKRRPFTLVEHLVRILDEVFEALEELEREAVGPDHHAGVPVEAEDLVQARQVLDGS